MEDFYVYVGLAGDTDPGRFVSSGMYRSRNGHGQWESIGQNLGVPPRSGRYCADPRHPGRVIVGRKTAFGAVMIVATHGACSRHQHRALQSGRSTVIRMIRRRSSRAMSPARSCAASTAGHRGKNLGLRCFPDITMWPEPMPKRVLSIAADPNNPDEIYACLEIGGLIRSLDGGLTWASVIDGLYVSEDPVDLHSVVIQSDPCWRRHHCDPHWRFPQR